MFKSRIEVNENGEFTLVIPEDIVEKYEFYEGEQVEWDDDDDELVIISLA